MYAHPTPLCLIIDEKVKATQGRIDKLEKEFNKIILNAVQDMEENEVEFRHLRLSVVNLPGDLNNQLNYFMEDIKNKMLAATSVDKIFFYLSDYWDFLDYHLLEHLIDRHASEKVKEEMQKYAEKIKVFKKETLWKIFCDAHNRKPRNVDKEFRMMVTKHDMDWDTATLEDIDNFRNDINSELLLSNFSLLIYKATHGSVEITWLVPQSLVALIQESIKQSSPSMKNHNVTKITIDGKIVYDNARGNFGAIFA